MKQDKVCLRCQVKLFFVWIWFGGHGPFCSSCSREAYIGSADTRTIPIKVK